MAVGSSRDIEEVTTSNLAAMFDGPKPKALVAPEKELPAQPDYCLASVFDRIFSPEDANVVLISSDGGTGKTFATVEIAYFLTNILGFHVLTNILFQRKTGENDRDWTDIDPHPNVHTVRDMVEFWSVYAEIKRKDPFAVVVALLDEWHKWTDKIRWWEEAAIAFKDWWGENRKYRTVPVMVTQQMANIPSRLLRYVRWYISKSKSITNEYNGTYGTHYSFRELAFIIPIRPEDELEKLREFNFTLNDVVEVLELERTAWTADRNTAQVGDVCYVSESSANFSMGEVAGDDHWFPKFLAFTSGCAPLDLPDRIEEFFTRGARKQLTQKQRTDLAVQIYSMHLGEDPVTDKGIPLMGIQLPGKRSLQEVELSPANIARLFKVPERTIRSRIRRWDNAKETSEGQGTPETQA